MKLHKRRLLSWESHITWSGWLTPSWTLHKSWRKDYTQIEKWFFFFLGWISVDSKVTYCEMVWTWSHLPQIHKDHIWQDSVIMQEFPKVTREVGPNLKIQLKLPKSNCSIPHMIGQTSEWMTSKLKEWLFRLVLYKVQFNWPWDAKNR